MHELEIIEDAVLAALSDLAAAGLARTLEPYAGQIEDAKALADLTARFPAVFVIPHGIEVAARNQVDVLTAEIGVLIADRNVRGLQRATRGDDGGPAGLYDVMLAVRQRLNGLSVISGWAALNWLGDAALETAPDQSICVFGSRYQTKRALKR